MISFRHQGDLKQTSRFLERIRALDYRRVFDRFGQVGVQALSANTPKDTGATASSWSYRIERRRSGISLIWENSCIENGAPVAILIQYGHGTRNGGYVQGVDYINPAVVPIFEAIAEEIWREVIAE